MWIELVLETSLQHYKEGKHIKANTHTHTLLYCMYKKEMVLYNVNVTSETGV